MGRSMPHRKEKWTKSNTEFSFGFISLFLVMIVLCLTIFSLLSFSTANSDYKLAEKSAKNVSAYYTAEKELQETLLAINNLSIKGKRASQIANEYNAWSNSNSDSSLTIESIDDKLVVQNKIDDKQYIEMILKITKGDYSIESYLLKTTWGEEIQ